MKTTTAKLILGNGDRPSDHEILNRTLKRWRRKLGYCSIFATIPALVISQVPGVLADETKKQDANVTYRTDWPDHVYSFTLTGLGPNPKIEVSTTSGTYRPLIYVMDGRSNGGCPAGTGNFENNWPWAMSDSRWTTGGNTATVNIDYLPL